MKILNKDISICLLVIAFFAFPFLRSYGQCGGFSISANDSTACIPQVIRFKVTGAPPVGTTFRWDFGSGFNPGLDTASYLFLVPGKHDIRLELSFPNSTKCVITKTDFIEVGRKPVASISLDKNVFCGTNDSVFITDLTPKSAKRDYIIEGIKYTDQDKISVHKFSSAPGPRDISVIITDSIGCEVIDNFVNIIDIPKPFTFDFTTDSTNGCTNRYANFKYKPLQTGQEPNKFEWVFENATPSTSLDTNPQNIFYSLNDSSLVSLKVSTKEGCKYTVLKENFMTLEDPIALTINVTQTDPCVGEYVQYDVSNSQNKKVSWQFFPDDFKIHAETDTSLTGEHRTAGSKVVRASQIYKGCLSQTDSRNKVKVVGPESRFTANKTVSCFNQETITFTNQSVEPAGEIITYKWYIKDLNGNALDSTTTRNYTYQFNGFGLYTVTLISYSNVASCTDTIEKSGLIDLKPLRAQAYIDPNVACPSQPITFGGITPLGSSASPNQYRWEIFDKNNISVKTSTLDSFDHAFTDTGLYSYKFVVYNNVGCYDSIYVTDSIHVLKPDVQIHISDSTPCKNVSITLDAVHSDEITNIVHYWYFTNTTYPGNSNDASLLTDSGNVRFRQPGIYDYEYSYFARIGPKCKDTFTGKGIIKVSGTEMQISTTNDNDCVPLSTSLSSSISKTQNFKNIYPSFDYRWKGSDASVSFATGANANTLSTMNQRGVKYASLVYRDLSGCQDSTPLLAHNVGVSADFSTAPQACLNGITKMINTSTLKPTKFKWFADDPSVQFAPHDSAKDVNVTFTQLGRFAISLVAFKNGCSDTITRNVTSVSIKAEFYSPQPINQCAPVIVEFIDSSNNPNITKRLWDFGDGEFAQTGNIVKASHAYINNTDTAGIDISLIVQNNFGCADTLIKTGYVKVLGPIPSLKFNNAQGCEPLEVEFINESKFFSRVYLEYGDGITLDSTHTANHSYRIFDEANLAEFYKPKLVLYDNNGCFVEFTPDDSIYVVQNAIADFTVLEDTGCETFRVSFINNSKRAFSYEWDFDNDGNIDNQDKDPFTFYNAGKHYPTLIAKSPTNCFDTLRNHIEIYVHAKPNAGFSIFPDTTCYNFPVTVNDLSSEGADGAKISGWFYDFGEELKLTDTSSNAIESYNYTTIGNNLITHTITDENGCVDSAKKLVFIRDTLDPENNGYTYITVTNGNELQLNWHKSELSIFKEYHIFNDEAGVITNLYNSTDISDTSLILNSGIDVDARRYCYTTKITDTCLRQGPVTSAHCNIYLRALDTFLGANQLRWSHYEGWSQRLNYEVYRKAPTDTGFMRIATLKGSENVYIDDSLCDINYCYYVICNHRNRIWQTQSNTACNIPKVERVKAAPVVDFVTVRGKTNSEISWHLPPIGATITNYNIYRSNGANGPNGNKIGTSITSPYLDNTVISDETAYTYRLSVNDLCGYTSDLSVPSHTIYLDGKNRNDTAFIEWNPYTYWSNGVKEYIIQMRDNAGMMNTIDQVSGNINTYKLNSLTLDIADSICFRVIAIEDSTIADSSYSNIGCIAPKSRVYVPTAFSPNGDGLNEIFKPVSIFLYNDKSNSIYDYQFEVFSRWGEKLYSTNDVDGFWDGNYLGKPVPSGMYIYRVDALGLDGVYHTYNGKVTLLR